jgi:hypothetical protein
MHLLHLAAQRQARVTFYRHVRVYRHRSAATSTAMCAAELASELDAMVSELQQLRDYQLSGAGQCAPVVPGTAAAAGDGAGGSGGGPCLLVEVPVLAVLEGFKAHCAVVTERDGCCSQYGRMRAFADGAGAGAAMARGPCWRHEHGRFLS